MSIMVTGGLGAIGSFAVRYLVESGEKPVVFDSRDDTRLVADLLNNIQLVRGDILDWGQLVTTMQTHRVERIIHTAALMPPACRDNPPQCVQVNALGFANVMESAKIVKAKRVVFASTRGVYADVSGRHAHPEYLPINEDHSKNPRSLYDASRFFCERTGRQYEENCGIEFVACRFASTYGPGKWAHGAWAAAAAIIDQAFLGQEINIPKGGDQGNEFLYNRDSGRALVLACFAQNLEHKQFNIGTGKISTLYDFAEAVRKALPGANINVGPGLDPWGMGGIGRSWLYDISRARKELGYEPKYHLEAGVRDYVQLLQNLNILGSQRKL